MENENNFSKKNIDLRKGMSADEVNTKLKHFCIRIKFAGQIYQGNNCKQSWICNCGEIFERSFSKIFDRNSFLCEKCRFNITEERYRYEVERTGEYQYIKSFRSGEIKPVRILTPKGTLVKDSPYIRGNIAKCCKGERIHAGKKDGVPLQWGYIQI